MMNILAALFLTLGGAHAAPWPAPMTTLVGESWTVLCWDAGNDESANSITEYRVFRSENGVDFAVAGTVYVSSTGSASDTRAFWDRGLTAATTYTYTVQALSATATVYSDPVSATTVPTDLAKLPFGATVFTQSGDGWVRLNWSANPYPGEVGVSIYTIFRTTHPDGSGWTKMLVENAETFLDDDLDRAAPGRQPLVNLKTYYYMFFPCCPDRCPSFFTAVPFLPAAGQGTPTARSDASAGPRAVRLKWGPAIPGSYTAALKYVVFRSDNGGSSFHALGPPSCVQGQWAACYGDGGSNGAGPPVGTLQFVDCSNAVGPVGPRVGEFEFVDCTVPTYGKRYVYVIRPVDSAGNLGEAYRTVLIDVELPKNRLFLNRNKFRPAAGEKVEVAFQITEPGRVRISVFTLTGELVRRLYDGQHQGGFTVDTPFNSLDEGLLLDPWDGTNDSRALVSSGAYLVVLEINKSRDIRAVVVIR